MSEPTEQDIQDAEAGFLLDIMMRVFAGRNMRVIVSATNSLLYHIAKDVQSDKAREFIAANMVACVNDINNLIVPPEVENQPTVQ